MARRHDRIVSNAQNGTGPCDGCPAQHLHEGELVNPGLGDHDGDLVFVTEEPRHRMDWSEYDSWAAYNNEWLSRFEQADGGRMITRLLDNTNRSLRDCWIADSVKCPTKSDERRDIPPADTDATFAYCRSYLRDEIEAVDPDAVVTLGKWATIRTLLVFGIEEWRARSVQVTKQYGQSEYETPYPLVISLHWAQRTISEEEWVPSVRDAIATVI